MQYTAQYTCSTYLAEGVDGNTNKDPKLTDDFLLGMGSSAKNRAFECGWMTDWSDVRALDLAGRKRILGTLPDMGCYETVFSGTTISIR